MRMPQNICYTLKGALGKQVARGACGPLPVRCVPTVDTND
jgi:hypothetical protein